MLVILLFFLSHFFYYLFFIFSFMALLVLIHSFNYQKLFVSLAKIVIAIFYFVFYAISIKKNNTSVLHLIGYIV